MRLFRFQIIFGATRRPTGDYVHFYGWDERQAILRFREYCGDTPFILSTPEDAHPGFLLGDYHVG